MIGALPEFDLLLGYLPSGWHPATILAFRERCVEQMPGTLGLEPNAHRAKLFDGYLRLHGALELLNIPTEQWVGGPFASRIDDPAHIDIVNFCDAQVYETLPVELKAMLGRYLSGAETALHCGCDSHLVTQGPPDHPCNADYLKKFNYWKKVLGHDHLGRPKGVIGLTIDPPPPDMEDDAASA